MNAVTSFLVRVIAGVGAAPSAWHMPWLNQSMGCCRFGSSAAPVLSVSSSMLA